MKTLTQTLLVSSLTAALWLTPAWAETPSADDTSNPAPVNSAAPTVQPTAQATPSAQPAAGEASSGVQPESAPAQSAPAATSAASALTGDAVTQDSGALSTVPLPQGLNNGDPALEAAASALPYAPGQAVTPVAAPPVVEPQPVISAAINQPISSTISVAQMGQARGITLTGGQLQSGITFTLPSDEVVTNARLNLTLRVSQALAARNTSLQLMLNGQPLGTLPLGASDSDTSDYQLDIPAAMVVSSNNLSFKINDADKLLCERASAEQYQVTIMPTTTLSL